VKDTGVHKQKIIEISGRFVNETYYTHSVLYVKRQYRLNIKCGNLRPKDVRKTNEIGMWITALKDYSSGSRNQLIVFQRIILDFLLSLGIRICMTILEHLQLFYLNVLCT